MQTEPYRLLRGKFRLGTDQVVEAGAVVALTPRQAASWANLFEPAPSEADSPKVDLRDNLQSAKDEIEALQVAQVPRPRTPARASAPPAVALPPIDADGKVDLAAMNTRQLRVFAKERFNRTFRIMAREALRAEVRALVEAEDGGDGS